MSWVTTQVKPNVIPPEFAHLYQNKDWYRSLHRRAIKHRGKPQHCEVCGTTDPSKRYDWANLTGQFHDLADYKRMCRRCHLIYDGAIERMQRANAKYKERNGLFTHCLKGHPYTPENTMRVKDGKGWTRACRTCREKNRRPLAERRKKLEQRLALHRRKVQEIEQALERLYK